MARLFLVLKDGWRWAAPVNAGTPDRAMREYLSEHEIRGADGLPVDGGYDVYNDNKTYH